MAVPVVLVVFMVRVTAKLLGDPVEGGQRRPERVEFGRVEAVERSGHEVAVVMGSPRNIKITSPADMELAEFYLRK